MRGLDVDARSPSGSSNQNVDPSPSTLSKPMRPPCASTTSRASESPRPVPPIERVSELSTRKNFEKSEYSPAQLRRLIRQALGQRSLAA